MHTNHPELQVIAQVPRYSFSDQNGRLNSNDLSSSNNMKVNTPHFETPSQQTNPCYCPHVRYLQNFFQNIMNTSFVSTTCTSTGQIKPNVALPHTGQRPAQSTFSQRAAKNLIMTVYELHSLAPWKAHHCMPSHISSG